MNTGVAPLLGVPTPAVRFTLGVLEADPEVVALFTGMIGNAGGRVLPFTSADEIAAATRRSVLDGVLLRSGPAVRPTWEAFEALRQCGVEVPIVVLSEQGEPVATVWPHSRSNGGAGCDALSALAGALGKFSKFQTLRHARREVRDRLASLTAREEQVAIRIASGRLNKEIAAELGISVRTVECHRSRLMRKLEVKSTAELAWMFLLERLRLDYPT